MSVQFKSNTASLEVMSQAKSALPACRRFFLGVQRRENMLTQSQLKELMHYCPETGEFTRLKASGAYKVGSKVGSVDVHGYIQIRIGPKNYKGHHLAWLYVYGHLPIEDLDHADRNRANNAIANLRYLTAQQHREHRGRNKNNTSGYRGVSYDKFTGRWRAQLKTNYGSVWLGRHDTAEVAYEAYKRGAAQYHTCNPEAAK